MGSTVRLLTAPLACTIASCARLRPGTGRGRYSSATRAVLVVSHGGRSGFPDGDGQGQVDAIGSQATAVIAQMCQFTKTGC